MSWHLRTTEPDSLGQAIQETVSGKRSFLWFTTHDQGEREQMVALCRDASLDILDAVPVWFVLACRTGVGFEERERMCRSILRGAGLKEARWRGLMFGYPIEEIEWYTQEVEDAWNRFYAWREREDG